MELVALGKQFIPTPCYVPASLDVLPGAIGGRRCVLAPGWDMRLSYKALDRACPGSVMERLHSSNFCSKNRIPNPIYGKGCAGESNEPEGC
ncbi:hypothetical protein FQZ97_845900 [compost metagenome]